MSSLPSTSASSLVNTMRSSNGLFLYLHYTYIPFYVSVKILNMFRRANFLLSHDEEKSDISETENCKTDKTFSLTRVVLEIICLGKLTATTYSICNLVLLQLFC